MYKRQVLDLAAQEGHCCLPQSLLHSQAAAVLGAQEDQVAEAVQTLLLSGKLVRKKWEDQPEAWIYPRGYFLAEGKVAHALKEIADSPVEPLDPVSYTHLDVYKRQGGGHPDLDAEPLHHPIACARGASVLYYRQFHTGTLIQRGGGTGPMKPGNQSQDRCQFPQRAASLADEGWMRSAWLFHPPSARMGEF